MASIIYLVLDSIHDRRLSYGKIRLDDYLKILDLIEPEFTHGFQCGSCFSIYGFICMLCRLLFVLLYFFFRRLCCRFLFDIRILITPLVSSNSSQYSEYSDVVKRLNTYYKFERSVPYELWESIMMFTATFNNISFISLLSVLLVEETRLPGENHRSVASH